MKQKILSLLLVFFAGLFFFSLWKIIALKTEYDTGSDTYNALEAYISIPSDPAVAETVPLPSDTLPEGETAPPMPSDPPEEAGIRWPVIDFDALAKINSDIVAWIYIPGTGINYPVVQGEDNDYYLTHMFDGGYNRAGCVFLDVNVSDDFSAMNSVLHGHNLMNGTMFAELLEYQKQTFYDEHPFALLLTPTGNYQIAFFSGYITDVWASAWDSMFTDADYILWQDEIAGKSCFKSQILPFSDDRVVTLSTCSYEFSNARFVLHGILIPETP